MCSETSLGFHTLQSTHLHLSTIVRCFFDLMRLDYRQAAPWDMETSRKKRAYREREGQRSNGILGENSKSAPCHSLKNLYAQPFHKCCQRLDGLMRYLL